MKNQNTQEFIDQMSYDWVVRYKDMMYMFNGWTITQHHAVLHIGAWHEDNPTKYIEHDYVFEGESEIECHQKFLASPFFDGKTFWEVEDELEVVEL